MNIYLVICVKNLKLYDSSMLEEEEEGHVLPYIEDLVLDEQEELTKDKVLQKRS